MKQIEDGFRQIKKKCIFSSFKVKLVSMIKKTCKKSVPFKCDYYIYKTD